MTRIGLLFLLGLAAAPGAHGQGWSTYSTAAYGAVPVSVGLTEGMGLKSAATTVTYGALAISSYRMHSLRTGTDAWRRWEQLDLDATTIAVATVAADAFAPIVGPRWAWGALVPISAVYLSVEQRPVVNPHDPILHTALWSAVALTGLAITEGWEALLAAALYAGAAYIRVGLDADGTDEVLHATWHGASALSAGVALNLDNFDLGFR